MNGATDLFHKNMKYSVSSPYRGSFLAVSLFDRFIYLFVV